MSETATELRQRAGSLDEEARKHNEIAHYLYAQSAALRRQADELAMKEATTIPVDRSQQVLVDGRPVPDDRSHTALKPNGQQQDYIVLSDAERAKGFVRPVRRTYRQEKCGSTTTMSQAIAETYARDPYFYNGTFCLTCGAHFPVGPDGEFVWVDGTSERVGT